MTRLLLPLLLLPLAACAPTPPAPTPAAAAIDSVPAIDSAPAASFDKPVSFAILEDWDKDADLADVARDFALFRELDVTTWRGSFGWDDYEPERGRYDFAWLHRFVELAAREGITLRPYVGYTAEWAAAGRRADGQTWNDPPRDVADWRRFVDTLARAFARHPTIASWEIYNEENTKLWWDGSVEEFAEVMRAGAEAFDAADSTKAILMGGTVWPDVDWVETVCGSGDGAVGRRVDVIPFHVYNETWPDSVAVEDYLTEGYREDYLPTVDRACGRKPIWANEVGFATSPGPGGRPNPRTSERAQANWWARAFATLLADRRVEHIGIYEIKDQRQNTAVIGEAANYWLGLTRADRTKKLAFHTVDLLTDLLDPGPGARLTVAPGELQVRVAAGRAGRLFHHLFRRPDGRQVLLVWDKTGDPTLRLTLARGGRSATEWGLDGAAVRAVPAFDGRTLDGVRLTAGEVRIFEIRP